MISIEKFKSLILQIIANPKAFVISLILLIITFPHINPVFSTGLDSPYFWAINWLSGSNISSFGELVFPYGPLGFLIKPLAISNNFFIGLFFLIFVRLGFTYYLLKNVDSKHPSQFYFFAAAAIFILELNNLEFLFLGWFLLIILNQLILNPVNKIQYSLILMCGIAFYIKTSIGLLFLGASGMAGLWAIYHKNYKIGLIYIFSPLIFSWLVGAFLFQNPLTSLKYIYNSFYLALSYGSGMATFPQNNWIWLGLSIISYLSLPFFITQKTFRFLWFISIPLIFINFKHSITREDFYHATTLIDFWVVMFICFLFSLSEIKTRYILQILTPLLFYSLNMKNVDSPQSYMVDILSVNDFTQAVFRPKHLNLEGKRISEENIKVNTIPDSIKKIIQKESIDIIPWDLSYIPANDLNWKPRPTLQSGAFSLYMDELNASHFASKNAPKFILWHFTNDGNYNDFGSLDQRYLLNDEPLTLQSILKNYKIKIHHPKFLLFEKRKTPLKFQEISNTKINSNWNKWIEVPDYKDLQNVKLEFEKSIFEKAKGFLYKIQPVYIEYLLENGIIYRYRLLDHALKSGIWLNPIWQNPNGIYKEKQVKHIRFSCLEQDSSQSISLNFNSYKIDNELVDSIFDKKIDSYFYSILNWPENEMTKSDSVWTGKNYSIDQNFKFEIALDTINLDSSKRFMIDCGAFFKLPKGTNGFWKLETFKDNKLINREFSKLNASYEWSRNGVALYDLKYQSNLKLKVQLISTGTQNLGYDDFYFEIKQ